MTHDYEPPLGEFQPPDGPAQEEPDEVPLPTAEPVFVAHDEEEAAAMRPLVGGFEVAVVPKLAPASTVNPEPQ